MNQVWHEDCLRCHCCDCRLAEVGTSLFVRANLLLCRRDYLRLFGCTGLCAACRKHIPAFEMVMRTRDNSVYHLDCFSCQHCDQRFCVGDRYYIVESRILCEHDYDDLMSMPIGQPSAAGVNCSFAAAEQQQDSFNNASTATATISSSNSKSSYDALSQLKLQTERMLPSATAGST